MISVLAEGWREWVWFVTVAEPKSSLILNAPLAQIVPGGFTVLMKGTQFSSNVAAGLGAAGGKQRGFGVSDLLPMAQT